jgi:hypothetical protein
MASRPQSGRSKTSRDDDPRAGADSDIWVGDVVRAWSKLGAKTPEERAVIAEILGFDYRFTGKERRRRRRDQGSRAEAADPNAVSRDDPRQPREETRTPAAAVTLPLVFTGEQNAPAGRTPEWLHVDRAMEAELPQHLTVRPPHRPLFRAGWTRAILSAACATASQDGPIEMSRVVDALANCRPVTDLPRECILSLRRGMQLLVDRGENLMPFARDIRDLQQQLLLVVGRDRSRVLYFEGCPTLGCGPGPRSTWRKPYDAPAPETPIVVLTDLGIARGSAARSAATEDTWLGFLATARSAGCPVIVFAPYPLDRWPPRLSRAVRAIPWDQPTTVSLARQAARGEGDRG